ncbi:hypothetical protein OEW28_13345 [Defluviimonas sp. WL0002]|uniref:DUF1828 domain-containing protein n=1 Tax=Albidovulum marisflavi TaxID=2984159 RepID=A0ABT2ZEU3_9RHOB|nr:hypothetical protein [Defluviimonas sp. WL0002]MCV2869614.1 hypothetical protein [Defluviimonas sp. WL0002]
MSLRSLFLDRVRRDRSVKPKSSETLAADLSPLDRHATIAKLIADSDSPREIRLSGQTCEAILISFGQRLLRAEIRAPGSQGEVFDFGMKADAPELEGLIARLNASLSEFCARSGELSVDILTADKPQDAAAGLRHGLVTYDDEAAIESLWETTRPQQEDDAARAREPGKGPEAASDVLTLQSPLRPEGAASLRPFEFLDGCRGFADEVTFFSEHGEGAYAARRTDDIAGDRRDLPALADWYDRVSEHLGADIFVVAIPARRDDPATAFALNGSHGAGIRFRRVNLGQVARVIAGSD